MSEYGCQNEEIRKKMSELQNWMIRFIIHGFTEKALFKALFAEGSGTDPGALIDKNIIFYVL